MVVCIEDCGGNLANWLEIIAAMHSKLPISTMPAYALTELKLDATAFTPSRQLQHNNMMPIKK